VLISAKSHALARIAMSNLVTFSQSAPWCRRTTKISCPDAPATTAPSNDRAFSLHHHHPFLIHDIVHARQSAHCSNFRKAGFRARVVQSRVSAQSFKTLLVLSQRTGLTIVLTVTSRNQSRPTNHRFEHGTSRWNKTPLRQRDSAGPEPARIVACCSARKDQPPRVRPAA